MRCRHSIILMHKPYETFFLVPTTKNHICTKCRQERSILIKSCSNVLRVFVTNGQRRETHRMFRNFLQPRTSVMSISGKPCFDFPLEILLFSFRLTEHNNNLQ